MKKIIKRLLLIVILLFVIFYIYRVGLMLYANSIDKKIAENAGKDYSVKTTMEYEDSEPRVIQVWYGEKYAKTRFYYTENGVDSKAADTWFDIEEKMTINEDVDGRFRVTFSEKEEDLGLLQFGRLPSPDYEASFATSGAVSNIKNLWKNVKDVGIIDAVIATVTTPILSVSSIKTEVVDGRECYVIKSNAVQMEKYIDKENYLPYKTVDLFNNSSTTYEYTFEPVTKESLEFPSLDDKYVVMN